MFKIWNFPTCLERRPKNDYLLIYSLELFFIYGYRIFINDMKTVVIYRGNIIMGTTNITATEVVYQFVFPSPRLNSYYCHQSFPHSSLNQKRWMFCLPSITESCNGDTSNRLSQIDLRRQKLNILLIALHFLKRNAKFSNLIDVLRW